MKKAYIIRVDELEVKENGRVDGDVEGACLLGATLHYPEPGVAAYESIMKIKVKDNTPLDLSDDFERILFYGHADIPTALDIAITDVQEASYLDKLLGKVLGAGVETVIGIATGGASSAIEKVASGVSKGAGESIIEKVFSVDDRTQIIGKCRFRLNSGSFVKDRGDLIFGDDIKIKAHYEGKGKLKKAVYDQFFKKDTKNGEIKLSIIEA